MNNPLPPPPRVVRRSLGSRANAGCARLILLPFIVVGLGLLLAAPLRLGVQAFGRPVTATVDGLDRRVGRKGAVTCIVRFHYALDGRRWDDQQQVTADELGRLHIGDPVSGRAAVLLGRSLCLTTAGSVNRQTRTVAVMALWCNGVVGLFVYFFVVAPWRTRRLLASGTAVGGEVTGRTEFRQRGPSVRITYRYPTPGGPVEGLTITRGQAVLVGQAVTVVYDPARPTRNVIYEFSGFTVQGARR